MTPALPLVVNPSYIYAQEEQAVQEQPNTSEPAVSQVSSPQPAPAPSEEPQASPAPEPSISPSESPSSSSSSDQNDQSNSEGQGNGSNENKAPPIQSSPSPGPSSSATLGVEVNNSADVGEVHAEILTTSQAQDLGLDLTTLESEGSAQVTTDKSDYTPTEVVVITGSGFGKETSYTLSITSNDPPPVNFSTDIKTDENGGFLYTHQLDGNYRPNYKVEVKDFSGTVLASTTFTDAPLSAPDSTNTTPLSNSSIKFEWKDKSSEENDFHIERKVGSGSFSEVGVVASTTTAGTNTIYSFEDSVLSCDTEYTYKVRAHRHSDNAYSNYSSQEQKKTLYISTNSVSDLTPDFATAGSTNVPILTFTLTSCKSSAKIQRVDVEYTGDDKNDLVNMKLYQESGSVPGSFDSSSDTLRATENTPGGGSYEFQINPSPDITIGVNTVQFYVTADIDAGATNGDKVDARIFDGSVKIDPNNPGGAENNDWPFTAELGLWNPSGETTIGSPPDTTPPTDPTDVASTSHVVDTPISDNTIDMAWSAAGEENGATDDNSGVDGYSYAFTTGEGDVPNVEKDAEEDATGMTSDPLGEFAWYFHLRTVDNEGNWSSTVTVGPFPIDTTAPVLSEVTPVSSPTNNSTPDYTFNSSEAGSISYSGDCSSATTAAVSGDNTITFNALSDGTYSNCTITVTDSAGNISDTLNISEFTVDTTAPTSTIDSPDENSFWNSPIEITGSSTDIPNTTVDYVNFYYRTSGQEENPWTEIGDSQQNNEGGVDPFNWSFNWIPPEEGTFDIKAKATDKATNVENSPVVEYVTYDVTGPVVSTPSASPDPTNHEPQILADAVDALSNIVSAVFSVNDPGFFFAKPLEALDGFFDSLFETLFGPEFTNGMVYPGEGLHTLYVGAYDEAGNFGSNFGFFTVDTFSPISSFSSPSEGSFWNEPINIAGSSNDSSGDTVDFTRLFYRMHQEDNGDNGDIDGDGNEWTEIDTNSEEEGIQPLFNTEGGNPFGWSFDWTPPEENTFDIMAQATDTAGNVERTAVVSDVTYDVTDPTSNITYPEEDVSYTDDEWDGEIRGTAEDSPSSGVKDVLVSIQRDAGSAYWDAGEEEWVIGEEEEEEYLNEAEFDGETGEWTFSFSFIEPEDADEGYTVRSHARDNAGNQEDTTEVHFFFSHGLPIISGEDTVNVGSAQVTFVWTTDIPATSRVVYDTVSHPDPLVPTLDVPFDKYGYAFTTGEGDTNPKVTSHTAVVCCFDQSTTYYYRVISQGSPEAQSGEKSFTTPATPPQEINPNSQGPGITTPSGPSTTTTTTTTTPGAVAGAFTQLGQVLGVGTGGEVLGEATQEATPTASPSPTPALGGPEEVEEAKAFWQNWWWLILLVLLAGGGYWWFSKKSRE